MRIIARFFRPIRPGWLGKLAFLAGLVSLVFLGAACGNGPSKEELAGLAAKGYYQHLVAGEYEQFVEGRFMADSLPADYRSQLIEGYKQFVAQQLEARKGIQEVSVSRAYTDSLADYTNVLLMLCYGLFYSFWAYCINKIIYLVFNKN